MSVDYIPSTDADFEAWSIRLVNYIGLNTAALGLLPADLATMGTPVTAFQTALAASGTAQMAAQSARQVKDTARQEAEAAVRALVRRLQDSAIVTDAQRVAMGITVKDKTMSPATATAVSASRPVGVVDTSKRLRHEIKFFDEATPTSRAKPKGVLGCEILVKIDGLAPSDVSECQLLGMDTSSPYVMDYPGEQAGKMAYYMLRWVNTRGEKGPVSETVAATITG